MKIFGGDINDKLTEFIQLPGLAFDEMGVCVNVINKLIKIFLTYSFFLAHGFSFHL